MLEWGKVQKKKMSKITFRELKGQQAWATPSGHYVGNHGSWYFFLFSVPLDFSLPLDKHIKFISSRIQQL